MKETQLLFTAPMIRALIAGTKSQTRRPVKGQALDWLTDSGFTPDFTAARENGLSPYGYAGDRLIVRETFYAWGHWETRFSAKKKRDEWHFVDMTMDGPGRYVYAADGAHPVADHRATSVMAWWKRPAIFMPAAASRILLEVTDVRVQRLQDISEADAQAEGLLAISAGSDRTWTVDGSAASEHEQARDTYAWLWDQINGAGSWEANPWVWAVSFRVLKGPQP